MFGLNRPRPTFRLDAQAPAAPNPLTLRKRHIDIQLAQLAKQPRTVHVLVAIDWWLDRRLALLPGGDGGAR